MKRAESCRADRHMGARGERIGCRPLGYTGLPSALTVYVRHLTSSEKEVGAQEGYLATIRARLKGHSQVQTQDPWVVFSTRERPLLPEPPPPLALKVMPSLLCVTQAWVTPLPPTHSHS